jgi:periplasmic protein TonB
MTMPAANDISQTRRELYRWTICALVVLLAHGLAALALIQRDDESDFDAGSPVAFIELGPVPVAPSATPEELPPGPPAPGAEQRDRVEAAEKPEQDEQAVQDLAKNPDAADAAPLPEPPKRQAEGTAPQEPVEASTAAAPSVVAETAENPAAPAEGRARQRPSASALRWERSLVAHLERSKRYPRDAAGKSGVARLAFVIDRQGRLLGSQILKSSGSAMLDAETLALVRRAEPFPAPPQDVLDDQLSFVVPIRYTSSFRR